MPCLTASSLGEGVTLEGQHWAGGEEPYIPREEGQEREGLRDNGFGGMAGTFSESSRSPGLYPEEDG